MTAMKFSTTVRVIWADTDAARIVWFGTYLRYLEAVEVAMFDGLGTSLAALLSGHRILLPRTTITVNYRSPARFDDVLDLAIGVESLTERRARLAFEFRQHESRQMVAEGSYEIACVDATTFKGRAFPDEIRALLQSAATST